MATGNNIKLCYDRARFDRLVIQRAFVEHMNARKSRVSADDATKAREGNKEAL